MNHAELQKIIEYKIKNAPETRKGLIQFFTPLNALVSWSKCHKYGYVTYTSQLSCHEEVHGYEISVVILGEKYSMYGLSFVRRQVNSFYRSNYCISST